VTVADLEDPIARDSLRAQVGPLQGLAGHRFDRIPPEFLNVHVWATRGRWRPFQG
jgi:hypothetical protein